MDSPSILSNLVREFILRVNYNCYQKLTFDLVKKTHVSYKKS